MITGRDRDRVAALEEQALRATAAAEQLKNVVALQTGQVQQLGTQLQEATTALQAAQKQIEASAEDVPVSRGYELLQELLGGAASVAGPLVSAETSLKAATVFACTRLLSEAVAGLPLPIYTRTEDGGREVAPLNAANGLWWLLNERPTAICSAASFWEWMITDMLLRGDGISVIARNNNGQAEQLIPIPRQNVIVEQVRNRLRYYVSTQEGFFGFDQDDVLHFPGFGFDGISGKSVIQYAAKQAIGIALASEEFAARFFSNGATPRFALEVPGALKNAQVEDLRAEFQRRYSGIENSHLPLILTHGAKAAQLSLDAEAAQLLQTRMFQVTDICRAFGVPAFMVGETEKTTTWGQGIEHMGLGFVRYTLRGPLLRNEQEMNYKFWPRSTKYFTAYDTDALMRGDSKAEAEYFRAALGGAQGPGWMSVNQIRRIKNWPKVPGGDRIYFPPETKEDGGSNNGTEEQRRAPAEPGGEEPEGAPHPALPSRRG